MNLARIRSALPVATLVLVATGAIAAPTDGIDAAAAQQVQNMSSGETLAKAKELVSKMQDDLREIIGLTEQAKKQKDVIKLNCVNEKLIQVKGHLAVSDGAMANLNEAVAKSDDDGRKHEYTRVSILYQKVLVLKTEARNCVGDDLSYVGAVTVQLDIDPNIPQRDYTAFDFPPVDTTRPPVASRF